MVNIDCIRSAGKTSRLVNIPTMKVLLLDTKGVKYTNISASQTLLVRLLTGHLTEHQWLKH
jgi:hypothetical protein